MKIRIAIADDNSVVRQSLLEKLSAHTDLVVKHIAPNGRLLIEKLQKDANVDIVLMDLKMPQLDGIETTREISRRWPQIKVLVVTMFDDDDNIFHAIMAGACGYLLKEDSEDVLHQGITDTLKGGSAMSPGIALKVLRMIRRPYNPSQSSHDFGLTSREIEILNQLKSGLTYEKIATNLNISYFTVRKHIENVYRKMKVNNRMEAVHKASDNNLLE